MNQETPYIKARQVADILGVSLPQVYAKASAGTWPSYRVAGMRGVRFKESEIRALVQNNLDRRVQLNVVVPKISGAEVVEYVESIQKRRNMVDRFLYGRPESQEIVRVKKER